MNNKIIRTIGISVAGLSLILAAISCTPVLGSTPVNNPAAGGGATQLQYSEMVEDFIKNNSTYKFDGLPGTIKIDKAVGTNDDLVFTIKFQTGHPGHGDRSGQMLAQMVTDHTAEVHVKDGKIVSAVCDNEWDMLKDMTIAQLGQGFSLPAGQTIEIMNEALTIKFTDVTTDSRSPKGVQTIWQGEAAIQLKVTDSGTTTNVTLIEKGLTDGDTQGSMGEYKVNFKLMPYPEAGMQPAAGDYWLQMTVTK